MQHRAMHAGSVYLTEAIQTATRALTVSCITEDDNETRADHLSENTTICELYLSNRASAQRQDTAAKQAKTFHTTKT